MKLQKHQSDLTNYFNGLYTKSEIIRELESKNIHGAFRQDGSFIGFDYTNQVWIDTK